MGKRSNGFGRGERGVCPCCLREYDGLPNPMAVVSHVRIGGISRQILIFLLAHFGEMVSGDDIVGHVYGYGGPLTARDCIKVYVYGLRKLLAPYGLTIIGHRYGGYMLTWAELTEEAAPGALRQCQPEISTASVELQTARSPTRGGSRSSARANRCSSASSRRATSS